MNAQTYRILLDTHRHTVDKEATAQDKDYFFALTTVRLTTDMGKKKKKKHFFYTYK